MNPGTIQAAHDDLKFQAFLARCFGRPVEGIDPVTGSTLTGFGWRGAMYVTGVTPGSAP